MYKRDQLRDIAPQDIRADAHADGHEVILTDDFLRVLAGGMVQLDVRIEDIRRIQFDIERDRPATMVIVPDAPSSEPQVMMVHPNEIETVARVLGVIGIRMAERGEQVREGIVLKDRTSTYRDGTRVGWSKVKDRSWYEREAWRFDRR